MSDTQTEIRPGPPSSPRGSQSAFWAISVAILKGFLRDRMSVFFALVFPLMFLVLVGASFDVTHTEDRAAALAKVRKGDADAAVEMDGNTLVAHYTQTDQVKAAVTQGTLNAFVNGSNLAESGEAPKYSFRAEGVEDKSLKVIQFVKSPACSAGRSR